MSSSVRDYQVIVDGTVVALGPMEYICDKLSISPSTARKRWMHDSTHRQWGSIDPLPYTWRIDGEDYTTERACELLDCTRKALTTRAIRGVGVTRVRVEPWALDEKLLSALITDASKWHRARSRSNAPR